ncbi:unnamed protein product, partial [Mesorhabditis belari]|uniref:K Homology domain-containing protein n=1 Tax=Mesorhabditis belari TaxID=2138241 RepID=A0AAF3JBU6_9BILA
MALDDAALEKSIEKARDIAANAQANAKRVADDGNESPLKRTALGGSDAGATTVPMMVPAEVATDGNTPITSTLRVQSEAVPMLIGAHGERISQLQSATHTRIQIDKTVCADSPNEQQCTISGLPEHVLLAQRRIQELMNRSHGNAEEHVTEHIMIPPTKVGLLIGPKGATIISLKSQSGAEMRINQATTCVTGESKHLTITGTKEAVEKAKALVARTIEGVAAVYTSASHSNSAMNETRTSFSGETIQGEIIVPRIAVGRIIGRGGEVIKNIGRRTNCQIQFKKDDDMSAQERTAVILAKTKDSLVEATQLITDIVQAPSANFGGRSENVGPSDGGYRGAGRICNWKGGETIKQINAESGAFCRLVDDAQHDTRTFRITGTPQQVHHAKHLILVKVGDVLPGSPMPPMRETSAYSPQQPMQAYGEQQLQYWPQQGMHHQQQWNQYQMPIQLQNAGVANASSQMLPMMPIQCQQQICNQLMTDQFQHRQMLQQSQQSQPDYSRAWVDYYRQLGMHEQADAVEAAIRARGL